MTHSLFAEHALLPSGWENNVLLSWDEQGVLTQVTSGAKPGRTKRAKGPVLPGMPNVHSHAFQRAMAGLAEWRGHPTDDFWTWREAMYALVDRLSPDDIEAIATYLYIEMLEHGYTGVAEFHYLHNQTGGAPYADEAELSRRILAAATTAGIRITHLPVLYTFGGFGGAPLRAAQKRFAGTPERVLRIMEALWREHHGNPRMRFGVAPHSVRAVDAMLLIELADGLKQIDGSAPIHIHASEQTKEVAECEGAHGVTPIAWLLDIAAIDKRWCLIHGTHVTHAELPRFAQSGAVAGLCPTTEANLGDGIFPLDAWLREGGRYAIGGDSHVSVSPFVELRLLEESQRLTLRARNIAADMDHPQVATNLWQAAAQGGAQALAQPAGMLATGRAADFVVLDGANADFTAIDAPTQLSVATFGPAVNRIQETWVAGQQLVSNSRHAGREAARTAYVAALRRLRS